MKIKVRAVILHEGGLVVSNETRFGRRRLSLPGGRPNRWEDTRTALEREVREETGLTVEPGALLYVAEVSQGYVIHDVNLVFAARIVADDGRALELVDPSSPGESPLFPPILHEIRRDSANGWEDAPRWLGNIWRAELAQDQR